MMIGAIASALSRPAGPPPWLPPGAVAHLDFVSGNYYAAEAVRSVTALLGGAFDAAQITGAGMEVSYDNTNRPDAAGALLADMQSGLPSGLTFFMEMSRAAGRPLGPVIYISDTGDLDTALETFGVDSLSLPANIRMQDGYSVDFGGGGADFLGSGTQRIAFTISRDIGGGVFESAVSVNGGTVASDTGAYNHFTGHMPVIGGVNLFWVGSNNIQSFVRIITIYPALASSELPALSA